MDRELRGAAGCDERRDRGDLAFAQREAGSRVDLAVGHLHDQLPQVAERLDRGERSFAVDLAELVSAAFESVGVGHGSSSVRLARSFGSVRLAPFGWSVRADATVTRRSTLRRRSPRRRQPAAGRSGRVRRATEQPSDQGERRRPFPGLEPDPDQDHAVRERARRDRQRQVDQPLRTDEDGMHRPHDDPAGQRRRDQPQVPAVERPHVRRTA